MLQIAEPIAILVTTIAFWHHSPPIRDQWVWLLLLALPLFALRLATHRRLWTWTPLVPALLLLGLLTAYNYQAAPYARSDYWVLVCRPLLGFWTILYFTEHARRLRHVDWLLFGSIGVGLVNALAALTASQWTSKSDALRFLIDVLPRVDWSQALPDMMLSFNVNEIAGAMAWLCPLMYGLLYYRAPQESSHMARRRVLRWLAGVAFALLALALFLGQSRFAIGGVLLALAGSTLLLARPWGRRAVLLGLIGCVVLLQAAILFRVLPLGGADGLTNRDERTVAARTELWGSGLRMMIDYPLTGVGMSMYRTAVNEERYAVSFYADKPFGPPHAHNEWVQAAADMGVPGLVLFTAIQVITGWMLWQAWRRGARHERAVVAAAAGALVAHGVYGIGDAVTFWDRFAFIYWWVIGIASAIFIVTRARTVARDESS